MEDETLVRSFEAGVAPPEGFHHREHVRVAWWYLRQHALTEALARFGAGLRHFAAANGTPHLYHETITTAYVLLINERLDGAARSLAWDAFAECNLDLLSWKPSVLDRYYHPDTLKSERARRTFVLPDRLRPTEACRGNPVACDSDLTREWAAATRDRAAAVGKRSERAE